MHSDSYLTKNQSFFDSFVENSNTPTHCMNMEYFQINKKTGKKTVSIIYDFVLIKCTVYKRVSNKFEYK